MKYLLITILSFSLFGSSITIIDNGIKRKLIVPKMLLEKQEGINARGTNSQIPFTKRGLLIKFKDSNIDLEAFAQKYGLKFKRKLSIGYIVFDNISQKSDVEIINEILANEKDNIKSIRPNWPLGVGVR